jgi:hypothetical protein
MMMLRRSAGKMALRAWCLALLLAALPGCWRDRFVPADAASNSAGASAEAGEPQAPFTLDVIDEINDGNQLHVLAKVTALADWPMSGVLLRLTGMKAGETRDVSTYPLKNALAAPGIDASPRLRAGQSLNLSMAAPAAGITDYQLELLWGKDAELSTQSAQIQRRGALLKVRHIEIETKPDVCEQPPCPVSYTVTGELFNAGTSPITQATLGIGFVFLKAGEKLDLQRVLPEREEVVEVPKLKLKAGEQRPLRIVFERPVPQAQNGYYQPVLRIIAFNRKRVG